MLFVGYFEGIESQRGIAWRCSDSLSLRSFLGLKPTEATPDHSILTIIRQRLPKELAEQVFSFMLELREEAAEGESIGIDSTTLEANAAMKSIVRKDGGATWKAEATREGGRDRRSERRGPAALRQVVQGQEGEQRRLGVTERP